MKSKLLGSLEQKIINVLWDSKKSMKPAEVLSVLEGDYAYTTIMTELSRMTEKGLLMRRKVGKAYFYTPIKTRKQFAKSRLTGIFGNIVDNFGKIAISQFVDTIKNNPDDIKLLEEYLKKNK